MKRKILYLFFFFTIPALFCQAQDSILVLSSTEVTEEFQVNLNDLDLRLELKVDVINNSADTLRLKWERSVLNQPENWETQGCDNNFCYLPNVSSNYDDELGILEPFVLPPDSIFTFTLYLLPNGQEGSGNFRLDFYSIDKLDSLLTAVDMSATVSSSLTNTFDQSDLEDIYIFPNPVANYFRISNDGEVDQVIVRNILGRKMRTYRAYSGARYNVFDLPQGVYLVSLLDRSSKVIKTMRMSKHSLRP